MTGVEPAATELDVYRVGLGDDILRMRMFWFHRDWSGIRYLLKQLPTRARRRSWWGLWQAEHPHFQRCPRGLTRMHACRRALRLLGEL